MTTIFKVFNPYTGLYSDAETKEEMINLLFDRAWEAYLTLCHENPVTLVTINPDGSQIWKNYKGEDMPNLDELRAQFEEKVKHHIPISILGA